MKLAIVFCMSLVLFYFPSISLALIIFGLVMAIYPLAGFPITQPLVQLKPLWWLLLALFLLQFFNTSWQNSALIIIRLSALFLIASLVNLTTPVTKMLDCFERIFSFVKVFGADPAKISLVLALTLRFISVFSQITQEVREAQKARGLEGNIFALTVPVIIRTLKMQDDVATAIDARCYGANKLLPLQPTTKDVL